MASLSAILCLTPSSEAHAPSSNAHAANRESCRWPTGALSADPGVTLAAEAEGGRLNQLAKANSAIGSYFDPSTSQFVVIIPASGPGSSVTAADFVGVSARVRVEKRSITRPTIDAILARIAERSWHPAAKQYVYGFYYDLRCGVIHLDTNAPREVVLKLLQDYPGMIDYQYGEARLI
jgi:hypothetical protein